MVTLRSTGEKILKRFLIGYALLTTCLLFMQREAQKPLLVYHADSKYAITGKVEEKRKIGSLFTITVNGNVFVVSEDRFEKVEIGDEVKI
nr:MAG TPA: Protein of unknown function (DUF1372) [Caudoviricetes sp.]